MQLNVYHHKTKNIYIVEDVKTTRCWGDSSLSICIKAIEQGLGWPKKRKTFEDYTLMGTISRETHPEYFI